ncbi:MAG: arabinogalactan endo-1,4-beta-galactosidase [Treponema sp.]|nr:arabinogalactan endo-1,4-beta-galactosidase [Treponema sp.]
MKHYEFDRDFAIGADISWYPQMQESGFIFRNRHGQEQDLLLILKEYGMDTIRLRTWVNPSDHPHSGHCSAQETLDFALQCKEAGFRIMLNFHYSDSWADPKQQRIPAAWEKLDFDDLEKRLYDYTFQTIKLFKENDLEPEWVQIGNETNPGMLLPHGSVDNFDKLTRLYNAGHDAVKAVSAKIKTMIHLAEFNSTDFIMKYFENLEKRNCRYDMMGFSFYPYHLPMLTYETCMEGLSRSMTEIPKRFTKDFIIVETGGVDEKEEETFKLLNDVIEEMKSQPKCKGILLWEPQGAKIWSGYPLSAWRGDGLPAKALDALCSIKKVSVL